LSRELLARCIPRRVKNVGNLAVDVWWCFFSNAPLSCCVKYVAEWI
jgi:hypothetical protein